MLQDTLKLLVVVAILSMIAIFGNADSSEHVNQQQTAEATSVDGNEGFTAAATCKIYVEDRLKAPSTADFSWRWDKTPLGNHRWRVSSYVDAQNSFGAMLRKPFTCTVENADDSVPTVSQYQEAQ